MRAKCGIKGAFAIVLLFAGTGLASPEDDPAQPSANARLAKILHEWELRSSARKSLDVRYTGVRSDPHSVSKESFSGRVVLNRKGQALVEYTRVDATTKKKIDPDRLIWTEDAMHGLRPESKTHLVWPIAAKDRGRLPAVLALPFHWNLSTEGLKSRYSVELVKEESETWILRITPLTKGGRDDFAMVFIVLDRATYLPRRYIVFGPDRKSSGDYRLTEARYDKAVPDEAFRIPSGDDWDVIKVDKSTIGSWIARLESMEFVP
jgi:hypothetical protein